ncbi:hypothetical protein KM043_017402 [Ampulex compressa]|nr:hypothetical protein KM043_017402 [Ampulex compressa]
MTAIAREAHGQLQTTNLVAATRSFEAVNIEAKDVWRTMSEQSEHASEETETEAKEEPDKEKIGRSESETNQTDPPMLEDEEMPTYISVSSPSRRDDSEVNNSKRHENVPMEEDHSRSPYPSDDQGGGSVYVLSSGDESDQHAYNEEEEEEYGDSEDEEEEEEEEDDEEHPLCIRNEGDDDIDGEYDTECYERASDDFILNSSLKSYQKERSLSLQDLSMCKNNVRSPYKKKNSLNVLRDSYMNMQRNAIGYPIGHRKQSLPVRYRHVESKVKHYIKNIKEQSRRSMEKRLQNQEHAIKENHIEDKNNDNAQIRPTITTKTIKDYAEKAIKDLEINDTCTENKAMYKALCTLENGEDDKVDIKTVESRHKSVQRDIMVEEFCQSSEKNPLSSDEKIEKRNGSVDFNAQNHIQYQTAVDRNLRLGIINESCLVNGHQQAPTLLNLRTLSYEEYMRGSSPAQKNDSIKNTHAFEEESELNEDDNDTEIINVAETDNSNVTCPLKIENVKSIRMAVDELKDVTENMNFVKGNAELSRINAENQEIATLKTQISQKNAQFDTLRDAYQRALMENMKMKQELDELKKSLAKCKQENKPSEMKAASVQTESISETTSNQAQPINAKEANKISSSSVASTISSLEQWTDSTCSPAISIKPPDVTNVLNSDDSIILTNTTPRKTALPLSRAFITSSRILQTLSNITQGKTRVESPLARNPKKRSNENSTEEQSNTDCKTPLHASNSKKRKATDMLGAAAFLQPFKIPHTNVESQKNPSLDSNSGMEFKSTKDNVKFTTEQRVNPAINNVNPMASSTYVEENSEDSEEQEDNVKCFVYREDENSKDRSFLIQAEEPSKDSMANDKGRIRECGPYLLGNVEVRMSEVNGTISIWGKEVSQESTVEHEGDMEISMKTLEKICPSLSNTPQTRFNGSQIVCSTNKKTKIPPKCSAAINSQCTSSPMSKMPLSKDDIGHRRSVDSPFDLQEKSHSCCVHPAGSSEQDCNCGLNEDRQACDKSPYYSKEKLNMKDSRRSSSANMTECNKHLHNSFSNPNLDVGETMCKYHTMHRRSPHGASEMSSQHSKSCNTFRDTSCACKSSPTVSRNPENTDRRSWNRSPSRNGEEDPLLPVRGSDEASNTRQRKHSGKRVRGILLDLLRGCGDCRNTSTVGCDKTFAQNKDLSCMGNGPPQIKISPCNTPEPSCSHTVQSGDRCCHAYARRIESQLEEFRLEMERVRSRSDAILNMLNMLHSMDMN